MNAADAKIAADIARRHLAAEARQGGQYQSVVLAIHQAVRKGEFDTTVRFKHKPHEGIVHAFEEDGYQVTVSDDEMELDIFWGHGV